MKLLSLLLLLPFQLSSATKIFLSPQPKSSLHLVSLKHAGARLAQHLGLEAFEPADTYSTYGEEPFVGRGPRSALLLSINEADVNRIMPSTFTPALTVSTKADSFDDLISSYFRRAQHTYSNVITTAHTHSPDLFFLPGKLHDQLSIFSEFLDSESSSFAAVQLDLTHADELAVDVTRAFVENAIARSAEIQLAILTYAAAPGIEKRQEQAPLPSQAPPAPLYSSCYNSTDACSSSTNSCSGHGQCVESSKQGCFVCACAASEQETWVGAKCERKDVSGPFVLIVSTVVVLLFVAYGSVSLLSSVGEQELPSTLMGGAVQAKRD